MTHPLRTIRVAQLGPAHPYRGGIVHFNSRLAQALLEREDFEVSQYFWSKPYPESLLPAPASKWLDTESRETFQVPGMSILSFTNPLTWLRLARLIRQGKYDLLITHWVHPVQFPVLFTIFIILRLFTKTKTVMIVHNIFPHERIIGSGVLLKTISFLVNNIILHSTSELINAKKIKIRKNKLILSFHPTYDIFNNVNYLKVKKNKFKLRDKVFLFFGFIRPYKGIDLLIEAFKTISKNKKDISLLIVGEKFTKKMPDTGRSPSAAPMESENIVVIDRYVTNEEVGQFFDIADILVAPYREATQSGPLQIAYAFDKPVIASDLPAFRDCVEHGKSGYLFETGNPEDLARCMELALEKPLHQEDIRSFRQRFTWERYVQIILDGAGISP